MAVTQIYTAVPNDVITAARWNNEFGNIYNNGTDLAFPLTKAVSLAGFTLTLDAAGVSTLGSSASTGFSVTTGAKSGTPGTTGNGLNVVAYTFTDSNTAGSGTAAAFAAHAIQRPTLAASNTSVVTTDAATLYIADAPLAGTNETITNPWAIWVDAGAVRFDGNLTVSGNLTLSGTQSGPAATTSASGIVELLTQAEYNTATDTTRVPTANLNRIVSGTAVATTSGTSFNFPSIPAGTKRIIIMFQGVSLSSTSDLLVQIGDSGGIETSGYISTAISVAANVDSTAGFIMRSAAAASITSGIMTLTLLNAATFLWVESHATKISTTAGSFGAGDKALSAELTQLTVLNTGADTFDAGSINILYER
jgi:hypothetical protein